MVLSKWSKLQLLDPKPQKKLFSLCHTITTKASYIISLKQKSKLGYNPMQIFEHIVPKKEIAI
jgi:hypothetical protein